MIKIGQNTANKVWLSDAEVSQIYLGDTLVFQRIVNYIKFVDPVVEQICATNWGDGTGITEEQAAQVTSLGSVFTGNTDIEYFEELKYFGITTIGTSLQDCSSLKKLWIPSSVAGNNWCSSKGMRGLSSLEELTIEAPLKASGAGIFSNGANVSDLDNLKKVNIDDLSTWLNCNFNNRVDYTFSMKSGETHLYYIGSNTEITSVDIPSTYTSIGTYAFYNCIGLTSVTIPSSVTSIGNNAFSGCSGITGQIIIPSSVTSIGTYAFRYCSGITDFIFNSTAQLDSSVVLNAGDTTGEFYAAGDVITGYAGAVTRFQKIQIDGDVIHNGNRSLGGAEEIRVGGNVRELSSYAGHILKNGGPLLKFLEIGGTIVLSQGRLIVNNTNLDATESIMHLKYNGIACTPDIACASYARLTTIYVDSQAVLNQYLADSDWSQYSAKLDLWSNYNGPYKV